MAKVSNQGLKHLTFKNYLIRTRKINTTPDSTLLQQLLANLSVPQYSVHTEKLLLHIWG